MEMFRRTHLTWLVLFCIISGASSSAKGDESASPSRGQQLAPVDAELNVPVAGEEVDATANAVSGAVITYVPVCPPAGEAPYPPGTYFTEDEIFMPDTGTVAWFDVYVAGWGSASPASQESDSKSVTQSIILGRCCSQTGCAETSYTDCLMVSGSWIEGKTCADPCPSGICCDCADPCPSGICCDGGCVAGYNELCNNFVAGGVCAGSDPCGGIDLDVPEQGTYVPNQKVAATSTRFAPGSTCLPAVCNIRAFIDVFRLDILHAVVLERWVDPYDAVTGLLSFTSDASFPGTSDDGTPKYLFTAGLAAGTGANSSFDIGSTTLTGDSIHTNLYDQFSRPMNFSFVPGTLTVFADDDPNNPASGRVAFTQCAENIPTVSNWGLMIIVLCLLSVAKVLSRRRAKTA